MKEILAIYKVDISPSLYSMINKMISSKDERQNLPLIYWMGYLDGEKRLYRNNTSEITRLKEESYDYLHKALAELPNLAMSLRDCYEGSGQSLRKSVNELQTITREMTHALKSESK
jgi:uncharacterized protein YpbB